MSKLANLGRALLAILAMAAGSAVAAEPVISDQQAERAGIAIEILRAAQVSPSIPAIGTVLDPAPVISLAGQIAAIKAQVAGANAKVVLEKQQMAQASALYKRQQVIPLSEYQKAAEDLASNEAVVAELQAKRTALIGQAEAEWGAALAAAIRDNSDPVPQVGAGTAMLVGLSLPPGKILAEAPREMQGEAAGKRFALRLVGPVPRMVGGFPGQGFLYLADSQSGIPIGATVSSTMPAGPVRTGVVVPRSAVLWQGGRAVVFRAASGNRFEPVPIPTELPIADGYFVGSALSPGDRVVVRGAALLPGAGQTRAPAGGDEDDKD